MVAGRIYMEAFVVHLSHDEELLRAFIEPLLDSEGFELVALKFKKSQAGALLALFVDTLNKETSVQIEDLTHISRFLSDVLDAAADLESVLKGRYNLEVSSPGLDRPLSKASHFDGAVSQKIKVRLLNHDEMGNKNLYGVLESVNSHGLKLLLEQKTPLIRDIAFSDILEAHIVFDFSKKHEVSANKA